MAPQQEQLGGELVHHANVVALSRYPSMRQSALMSDCRIRYSSSWVRQAVFTVTVIAPIFDAAKRQVSQSGPFVAQIPM